MAETSNAPPMPMAAVPATGVISPQFCVGYPVDLTIFRKLITGSFAVMDVNGNIIFRVKHKFFSLHDHCVLLDAAGTPIVTLRSKFSELWPKILTAHSWWKVFKGESTDEKDKIFDAKTSSTELHVFLASNTSNEVPDYTVKGAAWGGRSCEIYSANSSSLLAQMKKKFQFIGNDKFLVTMYPNVDSAFIVSLILIFYKIESEKERTSAEAKASLAAAAFNSGIRN